ncbi:MULTISPECIES: hypothetical protein [Lentilactobacillus]|uniref:Uncharacterized protein n=1 Tax=Lentilactobacillus kisonensis F0435 TaxID=797516 RepID=H1LEI1_9LACO|nr:MULTISPECIES: hypothetical protein [Lentilactobacillus]EHO52414.1 hypothetical protein HMPREF9104_01007 [Lentilactobacillus kisonensis F0435]MDM7517724.1 hypothetical protein [Lentilactobacillus sp. TOM.63]
MKFLLTYFWGNTIAGWITLFILLPTGGMLIYFFHNSTLAKILGGLILASMLFLEVYFEKKAQK